MAKTLKQFLEAVEKFKNDNLRPEDKPHVEKHTVDKAGDRNEVNGKANGDDVFKGNTKTFPRGKNRMGYDADLGAKVYEEAEQIDELSTDTLRKYREKARDDAFDAHDVDDDRRLRKRSFGANQAGKKILKRGDSLRKEEAVDEALIGKQKKLDKNHNGKLDKQDFKILRKEEAEQIDELSKETMGRYIKKAATKIGTQGVTAGLKIAKDERSQKNFDTIGKRERGISTAVKKLTKEDAEQIDELSRKTLGAYGSKALRAGLKGDEKSEKRFKGANLASAKLYPYQYEKSPLKAKVPATEEVEVEGEQIDEGGYSAKAGAAGKDLGKPGKSFSKIANKAAKKYGSKAAGERVAGAILKKLRKEEVLEDLLNNISESHQNILMSIFEQLSDDNKDLFLETCQTEEGIDKMLDFAITNRGR